MKEILELYRSAGAHVSSGRFTVSGGRRMAAHCLPDPECWPLKIVQALVALGIGRIWIDCGPRATVFEADWDQQWLLPAIEQALEQSTIRMHRAIEHLCRGLWSVAGHEKRPCWLEEGSRRLLIREGEVQSFRAGNSPRLRLRVGHLASRDRRSILHTLSDRAFFCPATLFVNGRRMDPLGRFQGQPLALGLGEGRSEKFPVPFDGLVNSRALRRSPLDPTRLIFQLLRAPSRVSAVCVIGWMQNRQPMSTLYWVHDGVVLEWEALELSKGSCGCAIFASAEGLRLEGGGLSLLTDPLYAQRFQQVLYDLLPYTSQLTVSPAAWLRREIWRGRLEALAMLVAGLFCARWEPHICWLWLLGGYLAYRQRNWDPVEEEFRMRASAARLQSDLGRMLAIRKTSSAPNGLTSTDSAPRARHSSQN